MRRESSDGVFLVCLLALTSCQSPERSDREKIAPHSSAKARWELDTTRASASSSYVEDQDFSLSAEAWILCEDTQVLSPKPGHVRVSVPVEVKSRSSSSVPVGPLSFHLEDSEGHRFPSTLAGCRPPLITRSLKDRDVAKGHVAFDVLEDQKSFDLIFTPFLIGRKESPARIRVPTRR